MIELFIPKTNFSSYEDFAKNFTVQIPESFTFAWDVMDGLARTKGDPVMLVPKRC